MQLDWLDGQMTDQCGQDHRPVSRSQSQENRKEQMTSDTCGPSGSGSSESADLQSYLESKLAPLSGTVGLIPCKKTWKQKTTPAQRRYCQLQVSALSTKEIGFGSWPTASARDHKGGYQGGRIRNGKWSVDTLDAAAQLAAWPSPTAATGGPSKNPNNPRGIHGGNPMATAASLIPWLTPTTVQGLWATPNTLDHMAPKSEEAMKKQAQGARKGRTFPCNLREQVDVRSQEIYAEMAFGTKYKPSSAKTEKSAPSQLNPRFSLWLMGYPIEWGRCAERVTPLSRKSRQK